MLTPPELVGIHTNMPATIPDDIAKALAAGGPAPSGLGADEKHAWDQLDFFYKKGLGYAQEMALRPQTLYAIADSPVGLPRRALRERDALGVQVAPQDVVVEKRPTNR